MTYDDVKFCRTCQTPQRRADFEVIRDSQGRPREVCKYCWTKIQERAEQMKAVS